MFEPTNDFSVIEALSLYLSILPWHVVAVLVITILLLPFFALWKRMEDSGSAEKLKKSAAALVAGAGLGFFPALLLTCVVFFAAAQIRPHTGHIPILDDVSALATFFIIFAACTTLVIFLAKPSEKDSGA